MRAAAWTAGLVGTVSAPGSALGSAAAAGGALAITAIVITAVMTAVVMALAAVGCWVLADPDRAERLAMLIQATRSTGTHCREQAHPAGPTNWFKDRF